MGETEIIRLKPNLMGINGTDCSHAAKVRRGMGYLKTILADSINGKKDDVSLRLATKCLINAARYGSEEGRRYAVEALSLLRDQVNVKRELIEIAKHDASAVVREAAEKGLREIRERSELDIARADAEMLLGLVYTDERSAQMKYIGTVFSAVEKIFTETGKPGKERDVWVAALQLRSFGADSTDMQAMRETIRPNDLDIIRKNVENALIHAVIHGDERTRKEAERGLLNIGSARIMQILQAISARERDETGTFNETGKRARKVLESVQQRMFGKSFPPPIPAQPAKVRNSNLPKPIGRVVR